MLNQGFENFNANHVALKP